MACLLLVSGCASNEERVEDHLEAAANYEKKGEVQEARLELESALRLDPTNPDVNLRLAQLTQQNGDYESAFFYFEEVHRLDPTNVAGMLGLVNLLQGSDLERAKTLLDEALALDPSNPLLHISRSSQALLEADSEAAVTSAMTAVELDPKLPGAQLQLGIAQQGVIQHKRLLKKEVSDQDFERAIEAFHRVRSLATEDTDVGVLVRAWTEEAKTVASWPGHREDVRRVLSEGIDAFAGRSDAQAQLTRATLNLADQMRDQDFLVWATERRVAVVPGDAEAWRSLARLTQMRGGDAIAVTSRAIQEQKDKAWSHSLHASYLAAAGRYDDAVAYLEGVPKDFGGAYEAILSELITLHVANGRIDAARKVLERLAAASPESEETYYAHALIANHEGKVDEALEWLNRWTSTGESARAYQMTARLEFNRGNPKKALEAADRALEIARAQQEPHLRPLLCLRGMALSKLGDHGTAVQVIENARRSSGELPQGCLLALADSLYALGQDEPAGKLLDGLIENDFSRDAARIFARERGKEDPKRARALVERALAQNPADPVLISWLVRNDLRAGKKEESLKRIREAVAAYPEQPALHALLGRVLLAVGQEEEGIQVLEDTLRRWPSVAGTTQSLVVLLSRAGRMQQVQEVLEAANAEGKLSPGSRVLLARLKVRSGDDKAAIELLEGALADSPKLASAANDLAYVLARQGEDLERATELAQEARAQEPDSAQIADTLGWVYLRRGLAEASLAQFEEAVDLAEKQSPAWATASYHRALALRELGRRDEAVASVEQALAAGADFPEAEDARRAMKELAGDGTG